MERKTIRQSIVLATVVAAIVVGSSWFPSSAQGPLKIAMRVKDMAAGDIISATGQVTQASITCQGNVLNAPRFFLLNGREGEDARQLMYFSQGARAGDKFEINGLVNDMPCKDPSGADFFLYEITPIGGN